MEAKPLGMETDLTAAGDQMQSAASRIVAWVQASNTQQPPYEVVMAAIELQDAINDWTEARR